MGRYILTDGSDRVIADGATNLIVAATDTLSAGDIIAAAPASRTALLLQDGNHFDLAAPLVLRGIDSILDRSVGNSVITLRDGLDLTLHLGIDNATVYGADNADTIIGGTGSYATIYLGSDRERVIAGTSGATVIMAASDAGARIQGRGVTTVTLTGAAGDTVRLGSEVQGVGELDVTGAGMHVDLGDAGIATVGLSATDTAIALGTHTTLVTDYAGGNTIAFTTADQTLRLPDAGLDPALAPDRIVHFTTGDAIDVDLPYGGEDTLDYNATTGQLTLTDTRSGVSTTLMMTPGPASFQISPDSGLPNGDNGTLITEGPVVAPPPPPCFGAGTRVLSARGWVCVEDLVVGDTLTTHSGQARPLIWIGHRTVDCRRHPDPALVQPIRIQAGAFADTLPQRDVILSPDHALFIDGVLVPAKYLVNGATLRQEPVASVRYFHLELESHDVILAEGLPVETYLDTDNRHHFANGGAYVALHPNFSPTTRSFATHACAPLVTQGPALRAMRARLLARAETLGAALTEDPDLHVCADGQRIWGREVGGVWSGWIPPNTSVISVVSRAAAPADCALDSDDRRRLGVALSGVTLIAADTARRLGAASATGWGDGFYAAEADAWASWRWTDGDAELDPALWRGLDGPFRLDLHVFRTIDYRVAA
jgi:hypothetical protein